MSWRCEVHPCKGQLSVLLAAPALAVLLGKQQQIRHRAPEEPKELWVLEVAHPLCHSVSPAKQPPPGPWWDSHRGTQAPGRRLREAAGQVSPWRRRENAFQSDSEAVREDTRAVRQSGVARGPIRVPVPQDKCRTSVGPLLPPRENPRSISFSHSVVFLSPPK